MPEGKKFTPEAEATKTTERELWQRLDGMVRSDGWEDMTDEEVADWERLQPGRSASVGGEVKPDNRDAQIKQLERTVAGLQSEVLRYQSEARKVKGAKAEPAAPSPIEEAEVVEVEPKVTLVRRVAEKGKELKKSPHLKKAGIALASILAAVGAFEGYRKFSSTKSEKPAQVKVQEKQPAAVPDVGLRVAEPPAAKANEVTPSQPAEVKTPPKKEEKKKVEATAPAKAPESKPAKPVVQKPAEAAPKEKAKPAEQEKIPEPQTTLVYHDSMTKKWLGKFGSDFAGILKSKLGFSERSDVYVDVEGERVILALVDKDNLSMVSLSRSGITAEREIEHIKGNLDKYDIDKDLHQMDTNSNIQIKQVKVMGVKNRELDKELKENEFMRAALGKLSSANGLERGNLNVLVEVKDGTRVHVVAAEDKADGKEGVAFEYEFSVVSEANVNGTQIGYEAIKAVMQKLHPDYLNIPTDDGDTQLYEGGKITRNAPPTKLTQLEQHECMRRVQVLVANYRSSYASFLKNSSDTTLEKARQAVQAFDTQKYRGSDVTLVAGGKQAIRKDVLKQLGFAQ